MTQVNPPYSLTKIRPTKDIDLDLDYYFASLERIMQQLYLRTGGAAGNTSSGIGEAIGMMGLSAAAKFEYVHPEPTDFIVSSNHTTIGDEFVRVTAGADITLNTTPANNEYVTVQLSGNFIVNVIGAINGDTSAIIHFAYDTFNFKYKEDLLEWVIE